MVYSARGRLWARGHRRALGAEVSCKGSLLTEGLRFRALVFGPVGLQAFNSYPLFSRLSGFMLPLATPMGLVSH